MQYASIFGKWIPKGGAVQKCCHRQVGSENCDQLNSMQRSPCETSIRPGASACAVHEAQCVTQIPSQTSQSPSLALTVYMAFSLSAAQHAAITRIQEFPGKTRPICTNTSLNKVRGIGIE